MDSTWWDAAQIDFYTWIIANWWWLDYSMLFTGLFLLLGHFGQCFVYGIVQFEELIMSGEEFACYPG